MPQRGHAHCSEARFITRSKCGQFYPSPLQYGSVYSSITRCAATIFNFYSLLSQVEAREVCDKMREAAGADANLSPCLASGS